MSGAREEILQRIRSTQCPEGRSEGQRLALQERSFRPPRRIRPQIGPDLLAAFCAKVEAAMATVGHVAGAEEIPAVVADRMAAAGLSGPVAIAASLASLPWPSSVDVRTEVVRGDLGVSVTPCFLAVAETGSLVLLSGPSSPTTFNFLAELHVVVVEPEQIVSHLEDVWIRLRRRGRLLPRSVNFISGPSRTADVEQTMQLGAHGPRHLHVLLSGAKAT